MLRCCSRRRVDIDTDEFYFPCVDVSQFFQNRCLGAAVASPGGGEFDGNRTGKAHNLALKSLVRNVYSPVRVEMGKVKPGAAFPADGSAAPAAERYAVLRVASGTTDNNAITFHKPAPSRK